ncbi:MAG: hypothetical protein VX000_01045, partial [Myxococcota bacterium]|nr:hypothetical protein [Myxococcota bacterium]
RSPSAASAVPDEPQASTTSTLPTPFTLAQLQAGWVPGVTVRFHLEAGAQPATLHEWEVVSTSSPDTVATAITVLAEDGTTVLVPRTVRTMPYEDFRLLSAFPSTRATVEQARVETPAGTQPGRRYRVRSAEVPDQVQLYEFADALAGPPVLIETRDAGTLTQRMRMVSRTPGSALQ